MLFYFFENFRLVLTTAGASPRRQKHSVRKLDLRVTGAQALRGDLTAVARSISLSLDAQSQKMISHDVKRRKAEADTAAVIKAVQKRMDAEVTQLVTSMSDMSLRMDEHKIELRADVANRLTVNEGYLRLEMTKIETMSVAVEKMSTNLFATMTAIRTHFADGAVMK